jgi:hypothetical protein
MNNNVKMNGMEGKKETESSFRPDRSKKNIILQKNTEIRIITIEKG